jgi:hypothetical protein
MFQNNFILVAEIYTYTDFCFENWKWNIGKYLGQIFMYLHWFRVISSKSIRQQIIIIQRAYIFNTKAWIISILIRVYIIHIIPGYSSAILLFICSYWTRLLSILRGFLKLIISPKFSTYVFSTAFELHAQPL